MGKFVDKSSKDINCFGIYAFNTELNDVEKILAKVTVLASGGAGHVYSSTTNPVIATGDGMAMVYRAKGKLRNMEFIQFHPTALYNPGEYPSFLISEAIARATISRGARDPLSSYSYMNCSPFFLLSTPPKPLTASDIKNDGYSPGLYKAVG